MDFDFKTLITDRSAVDLELLRDLLATPLEDWTAEQLAEFNLARSKGAYNYTDLNRVTACMDYLNERLTGYGYATGYQRIEVPHKTRSRLPKGYTELAYIESTGTQYVDTGFQPNQDTKIEVKFQTEQAQQGGICVAATAWVNNGFGIFVDTSLYGNSNLGIVNHGPEPITCVLDKNTLYQGESVIGQFNASEFQVSYNLFILAWNQSNSPVEFTVGKLYSCKIYDNDVLIRDFTPCKNPLGSIGLYDLENNLFYENSGTGEFIAGPTHVQLPEGYTQLEYIASNGSQYIDTGFKPNQDTRVVCDTLFPKNYTASWLFGARETATSNTFGFLTYQSYYRSDYNNGPGGRITDVVNRVIVDKNKNVTSFDNEVKDRLTYAEFQCPYNLYLFANNNAGTLGGQSTTTIYSCQIYDNGILIRDYVPAKNVSGLIGLYDLVNGIFYQNSGTGVFTFGAEIGPPEQAEIEMDPYTWYEDDTPTESLMDGYIENIEALRSALKVTPTTPQTPESIEALTWATANNIEQILMDIQSVVEAMSKVFVRSAMLWAVAGNNFYFAN